MIMLDTGERILLKQWPEILKKRKQTQWKQWQTRNKKKWADYMKNWRASRKLGV